MSEKLKVNLGCGPHAKKGYVNVDVRDLSGVDVVQDLTAPPYPFMANSVDEIYSSETFEHISWRKIDRVFKECYRILKPAGKIRVSVPDIGRMCKDYVAGRICECVPHKADSLEGFKADPDCSRCEGKATVNPVRWKMAFLGAQKHHFDYHKMFFTKEIMRNKLAKSGFNMIKFKQHLYKIKVTARKPK